MGEREAGEANLRLALRGRPQMIGPTTYAPKVGVTQITWLPAHRMLRRPPS